MSRITLPALAFALGAGSPAFAFSGDPVCGKTIEQQIKAAEGFLLSKDENAPHSSLACLIQAVKALNAAQPVAHRGSDGHEVLHVPVLPGGPGKP